MGADVGDSDVFLKSVGWSRTIVHPGLVSGGSQGPTFHVCMGDGHCHLINMAQNFWQKQPAMALQLAMEEANNFMITEVDVVTDNQLVEQGLCRT